MIAMCITLPCVKLGMVEIVTSGDVYVYVFVLLFPFRIQPSE